MKLVWNWGDGWLKGNFQVGIIGSNSISGNQTSKLLCASVARTSLSV